MTILINYLPFAAALKDINAKVIVVNQAYAELYGKVKSSETSGCDLSMLCCDNHELMELLSAAHKRVISNKIPLQILSTYQFKYDQDSLFNIQITPILDTYNEITSVLYIKQDATKIASLNYFELMQANHNEAPRQLDISPNLSLKNQEMDEAHITPKEAEVLFYLLRHLSASKIARYMNISKRTVETHKEHFKAKFSATSTEGILEAAKANGYLTYIPKGIYKKKLFIYL